MPEPRVLAVLVAAEDPLARAGVSGLLQGEPGLDVRAEPDAADAGAADVVVLDAGPAPDPGPLPTSAPVLVLVPDASAGADALGAGARGALLRHASGESLRAATRAVAAGAIVLDDAVLGAILAARRPAGEAAETLTARELDVLALLAEGLSNKRIAARLGISDHTVKFHVNAILLKLEADTRTEAVVRAARLGLLML